jgi:hypothetical protein
MNDWCLDSLFVKYHKIEKALDDDDDDDVLLSYAEICSYVCLGFNLWTAAIHYVYRWVTRFKFKKIFNRKDASGNRLDRIMRANL